MNDDADRPPPGSDPSPDRPRGPGLIILLILIALILAIGFFYLTNDDRRDRRADALMEGAASVDNATRAVSEAARNAADRLRNAD